MNEQHLRRALEELRAPDEEKVHERCWNVVSAAYVEREPVARQRVPLRAALVVAMLAVLGGALASAPGRAVIDSVREAVGVERAQPALFSLPAPGRLLATSRAGAWVVDGDGSKRLVGAFDEASWSPFGRYVVATRTNELATVEPDGTLRWTLARPNVSLPRWGGTPTDTAIAYLTDGRLHVVAGDGTGDRAVAGPLASPAVAPAWEPGGRDVIAYLTDGGRIAVYELTTGVMRWLSAPYPHPRKLLWSAGGERLLLVTRDRLVVFAAERPRPLATRIFRGVVDAAFAPTGDRIALLRPRELLLLETNRLRARAERVFAGTGPFESVAWSPDGRWLLVAWPDADQWVFVESTGQHRLVAVADLAGQFGGSFPTLDGWCCSTGP